MDLTIILITKNKEIIRNINKKKHQNDEVIIIRTLKSSKINDVINTNILNALHKNILIVNPSDHTILDKNSLEQFREKGVIVNNTKKDNTITHKTSIKIEKNTFSPISHQCNKIIEYINILRCGEDYTPKTDSAKKITDVPEILKYNPRPYNKKPKVLMICDVKGWAWWLKSEHIKKHISDEFDIDIINMIGPGKKSIDKNKYDIYFTYGYSFVNYMGNVPRNKKITGITAHRDVRKISNKLKQAGTLHANSVLLYNEYRHINKNIFYVPNGVDEQMFYPKKDSDLMERDKIIVGHVGKKSIRKRQVEIIEPVMKRLKNHGFVYKPHYNNYMTKVPHKQMPDLYQDFDLLIVASREDGTPNSLLESGACGVPTIGNNIGNIPEFIHSGYNGYMINTPTIDNYVNLMKRLTKEHIIEMGKHARITVENGWTWKIQAERYRHMFRNVMENQ